MKSPAFAMSLDPQGSFRNKFYASVVRPIREYKSHDGKNNCEFCKSSIPPRGSASCRAGRRPPGRVAIVRTHDRLDGARRTLKSWVVNVTFHSSTGRRGTGPDHATTDASTRAPGTGRAQVERGAHGTQAPGARGASRSVRGRRNRHGNPQHIMRHQAYTSAARPPAAHSVTSIKDHRSWLLDVPGYFNYPRITVRCGVHAP